MILDLLALVLLALGVFFLAVASIGFVRLPDVFCRLHITGVIDTMGAPLVLLAAAVYLGVTLSSGKLLLAIVFLYMTAPLVGHLLALAAVEAGHRPKAADGAKDKPRYYERPVERDTEDDARLQSSAAASQSGGEA